MDQREDLPTNIIRNVTDHSPAALWTAYNNTGALHPSSAAASNTTETRSRVPKACETCCRRKRKCDGASPCSWCYKNNIECIFVLERPKRKKQDSEVVSNLEDQLLALKDYVRKLEATCGYTNLPAFDLSTLNESSIGQHDAGSKRSSDIMSHETDKTDCEQNDDTHASAVNDVSSMMWRMNIHGSGETSFVGPSGSFCFPSTRHGNGVIKKSEGYSANIASSTHQVPVINNPLEAEGSNRFLLDLFSQHINPVHKFVPAGVVQVLEIPQASLDLELLQVSVLAAASILTDNPKLQKLGQQYADRAETIVMHCCRTLPNVSTARALSILSWRELGLENENNAWLYNSMAASLTLHLGLHVSSFENVVQMPIEKQNNEASFFETDMSHVRIQTFWSIFLMDRIATSMLGRNCMLPWRRVRATPYLKACLANPSLEDTVFNSLCQMWFIHDRYMDKIYSFEFDEIESVERHRLLIEARDHHMAFFSQLGKDLELKKNNMNCKVILLHMVYHMSLLLIHRPYLIEPKDSAPHRLSVRTNITASHALVKLIRQYGKEGSLQHAPFFAVHCVLTAAVSLLLNATSTNPTIRSQSVHRFRVCVNALEEMQKTWPRAKRGIFLLRELADRWKVVSALPLRHSVPIGTETVGASYSEAPNDIMLDNATGVGGSVTHKDNDETQLDWGMLFANLEEPLDLVSIDLSTPTGDWLFTEANSDEAFGNYEGSSMSDI